MKVRISLLAAGLLLLSPALPSGKSPSQSRVATLTILAGTALADGCSTDAPNYKSCIIRQPQMSVAGQLMTFPNQECARLVFKALLEKRSLPVEDPECSADMKKALELQKNDVPPYPSDTILRLSSAFTAGPNAK